MLDLPALLGPKISVMGRIGIFWVSANALKLPICSEVSMVSSYFFLVRFSRCERALAAAVFDALLVRPSVRTLEAADAAGAEVVFFGAAVWLSALAAAVFDFVGDVALLVRVLDALLAAFGLVTLVAIVLFSNLS